MIRKYNPVKYTKVEKNADGMWVVIEKEKLQSLVYSFDDSEELDLKDLLTYLKSEGVIATKDLRKISATVGQDLIEIYVKKTLEPLCRLEKSLLM